MQGQDLLVWKEITCPQGCRGQAGSSTHSSEILDNPPYVFLVLENNRALFQTIQPTSRFFPASAGPSSHPIPFLDLWGPLCSYPIQFSETFTGQAPPLHVTTLAPTVHTSKFCLVPWFLPSVRLPPSVPSWFLLHVSLAKEFPLHFIPPPQSCYQAGCPLGRLESLFFLPTWWLSPFGRGCGCPQKPVSATASYSVLVNQAQILIQFPCLLGLISDSICSLLLLITN